MEDYIIYMVYLAIMSLITFSLYCSDKRKAIKHKWRIKESKLLFMSLIGGCLGGLMAMYSIRHKNRKWYFVVVNFSSLLIHIFIIYYFWKL